MLSEMNNAVYCEPAIGTVLSEAGMHVTGIIMDSNSII